MSYSTHLEEIYKTILPLMGFELKGSSYMFTGLQCAVTKTFSNHYGKGCIQIIGAFCTNFYSIYSIKRLRLWCAWSQQHPLPCYLWEKKAWNHWLMQRGIIKSIWLINLESDNVENTTLTRQLGTKKKRKQSQGFISYFYQWWITRYTSCETMFPVLLIVQGLTETPLISGN